MMAAARRRRHRPHRPGVTIGLDARPSNLTLRRAREDAGRRRDDRKLQRVFSGLTFNQPLAMLQAPGDDTRWFVVEKGTVPVRVFQNTPNVTTASNFISVTVNASSEGGLLGMAFHPQWATNRLRVLVVHRRHTDGVDRRAFHEQRRRRSR